MGREASRLMVGLLHIAATANCEKELGETVTEGLLVGVVPSLSDLRKHWGMTQSSSHPMVDVTQHTLESYNQLIPSREVYIVANRQR